MDQHPANNRPVVAVVMGVSGSGKTTIAILLAETLGWQFSDPSLLMRSTPRGGVRDRDIVSAVTRRDARRPVPAR